MLTTTFFDYGRSDWLETTRGVGGAAKYCRLQLSNREPNASGVPEIHTKGQTMKSCQLDGSPPPNLRTAGLQWKAGTDELVTQKNIPYLLVASRVIPLSF